ncbi:MAG: hypothetical protein R2812_09715 [Gelidibacter sp.]
MKTTMDMQADLETRTQEIINGELDIAMSPTCETMDDANTGQNPLVSPYNNIVPNTQTVYARAENTVTGCYSIVALELNVTHPVVPLAMADYVVCDTDNNGIAQFDLTTQNAIILGTQNPSNFTLTYHLSQANADAGTNPIVNVGNYTNIM